MCGICRKKTAFWIPRPYHGSRKKQKKNQGGKGGRGPNIFDKDCFKKGARDYPPPPIWSREETYRRFCAILRHLAPSCAVLHRFAPFWAVLRRFAPSCAGTALHRFLLRRLALFCTVLRCFALFCTVLGRLSPFPDCWRSRDQIFGGLKILAPFSVDHCRNWGARAPFPP